MFDVFISHSSVDDKIAFAICKFLEKKGLKCWIAPRNVKGGTCYSREIMNGINDSQVFLLLYSSASNKSKHVISELDVAFNSEKAIIPFCLDSEEMSEEFSYYLAATHRIIGYPTPLKVYDELKEIIISHIPALASAREREQMFVNVAKELGMSLEELKKTKKLSVDDCGAKSGPKSRYDILQNKKGETLMILQERNGKAEKPVFILDAITKYALLHRSHKSTVLFNDFARETNEAIRKVKEIQIVEIRDYDVVREYKAPVCVVNDVRELMDALPNIPEKELKLLRNIKTYEAERIADVVISPENEVMIIYEGDMIDDNALFLFQDTGDCILFPTDGPFFIVTANIPKECVTRLAEERKVYVHCLKNTLDEPDKNERERIASAVDLWRKGGFLPPHTIKVESVHVASLLLFLSQMWWNLNIVEK